MIGRALCFFGDVMGMNLCEDLDRIGKGHRGDNVSLRRREKEGDRSWG